MGTDRSQEYIGPCSCGAGTYEIDHCTPDHGWPVANPEWYESRINCELCSRKYAIHRFGTSFFLVTQSELRVLEKKTEEVYAAADGLKSAAAAKGVLDTLIALLDDQSSLAAKHRLLTGADLEYSSLATFRKRWTDSQRWVNNHVSGYNVARVMVLLGVRDAELEAAAKALEQLRDESAAPPTPVGAAIYQLAQ